MEEMHINCKQVVTQTQNKTSNPIALRQQSYSHITMLLSNSFTEDLIKPYKNVSCTPCSRMILGF